MKLQFNILNMQQNIDSNLGKTVEYLSKKTKILFLTTSNRWSGEEGGEMPKSTALAYKIASLLPTSAITIIEVPKLNIHPCEGNVSTSRGNTCGQAKAMLEDSSKNPSGFHRCWASINNPDDELWKISKELFISDCVIFFGSIRWGQLNSYYQKLIERLTWIENRHSNLGENNVISEIEAGIITVGHNWHGQEAMETQKKVLEYFGFKVSDEASWHWQFTQNADDESYKSYEEAAKEFQHKFLES